MSFRTKLSEEPFWAKRRNLSF